MMDNLEILKLKSAGLCCSQIMVSLMLGLMDRKNPDLVNFARGLCRGYGAEAGDCGILTAGICIMAMMAPGDPDVRTLLQERFAEDVRDMAGGDTTCRAIAGEYYPEMNPTACGDLLARAHARLLAILVENGIDPADPPTES